MEHDDGTMFKRKKKKEKLKEKLEMRCLRAPVVFVLRAEAVDNLLPKRHDLPLQESRVT